MSTYYLTQPLHKAKREYPKRLVTIFGSRQRTYGELYERVSRLAAGLRNLGMETGDRVGILAANSDRYLELYFAVWWGGGVVNPVNIRWSAREIAFSLDNCDTQLLVVDDNFTAALPGIAEKSLSLRTVIYMGDDEAPSGMFDYEQLIVNHEPVPDILRANDDLAGVFYTGGTTGQAKGVMLSHSNLFSGTNTGLSERVAQPGDVGLHVAPMFHMADVMFLLVLTMLGCTQVILPAFQPASVLRAVQDYKVSAALLVPTMIQMVVDSPDFENYQTQHLKRVVYGASPISESLLVRSMTRLPEAQFLQCYGQTEMSPIVSVLPPDFHCIEGERAGKIRSAGRPAFGVEVKIINDQGDEVACGEVGEILARGPGAMLGYWDNPQQTEAALQDGWVHTGDGGYLDVDGFLFVVDRVKDMIVSGGENVYSAEVENALAQHESVASCAVIGIPDETWGEAVHAIVVAHAGKKVSQESMIAHCRELIAGYKCPRSVEFRDSLPLSGAGKILKAELREPFWKGRDRKVS